MGQEEGDADLDPVTRSGGETQKCAPAHSADQTAESRLHQAATSRATDSLVTNVDDKY